MRNHKRKCRGIFLVLLFAVLFLLPVSANASNYGEPGNGKSIHAYPLKKTGTEVFADEEMQQPADTVSYSEFQILQISGETAQVQYKIDGEKKTGYTKLSYFVYDTAYQKTGAYVYRSSGLYLYKRPSTAKAQRYVAITYRSGGLMMGVKGKYVQVLMERKGQFYLGWVTASNYGKTIYSSMVHTDQILADGTYTLTARTEKSDTVKAQKYKVSYQGNGLYTLQNTKNKTYLKVGDEEYIKLVRKGAWFFLRTEDETVGLNYQGRSLPAVSGKKQQWKLSKVYAVPTQEESVVYSQYDPQFGSVLYMDGYDGVRTISSSGCGLISLVNAIYALNGEYIPPAELAAFSASRGHYFYNQGTADTLYADVARKWGKIYHFRHAGKATTFSALKKHLQKKGTAVALVPGHYIAIVAYRKSDGKYLVLDSSVTGSRPTTIYGDWKTMAELQSGRLTCYYFHLFSARK